MILLLLVIPFSYTDLDNCCLLFLISESDLVVDFVIDLVADL